MVYESCFSNYMSLQGNLVGIFSHDLLCDLGNNMYLFLHFWIYKTGSTLWGRDNDYTMDDSLYHMVRYLRLRMYRCIFLEGGENLWWIHLWFVIIYHLSSEKEICALVLSTKKLRNDPSLITTKETMNTDWFLYLCFPFLMISSSFIYLYS